MAELVANGKTTLKGDEVIIRAVQFFTTGKWRTQSQSDRIATFAGRPSIPVGLIILTIIGFIACIVPGVILYIMVIRRVIQLQNIVVTVSPITGGTEVVIKHSKAATKLVTEFLNSLPALGASA